MEQTKTIILAIILALTSPVFADGVVSDDNCAVNVQIMKKGQSANCDGFLFSKTAERNLERDRDDAEYYKSLSDKLTEKSKVQSDENTVLEQRLKLYIDESHALSKEAAEHDTTEGFVRFGYFIVGVLVVGLAMRNFHQ